MAGPTIEPGARREPSSDVKTLVDGDRLVFVGGLHRSGTSIVHRCLRDHPDISGFEETGVPEDEGQHLQSLLKRDARLGGPGLFGYHRDAHLDEESALASPSNAVGLLEEWVSHWDTSKRLLIEKSPPNLLRTRFLQGLFPGAHFIMVLRHPVAVGYATQKWTSVLPWLRHLGLSDERQPKVWIHRLIDHWLHCHEAFERDRSYLRRVHVLRYEDFVENPRAHLESMWSFLGLPSASLDQKVRQGANDRYWERWLRRRQQLLTRAYSTRVVRLYEERVSRFGYSLIAPEPTG